MKKSLSLLMFSIVVLFPALVRAQPAPITDVPAGSTRFTTVGDLVYFIADDALWRTDGTATGTAALASGFNGFGPFRQFNGDLYFLSGRDGAAWTELWKSDGTSDGTIRLTTTDEITFINSEGGFLYFAARTAMTGRELYRTNGTPAGTILLRDINPGPADGLPSELRFRSPVTGGSEFPSASVQDILMFGANNGTDGNELWKTDGTPSGTSLVEDILPGPGNGLAAGQLFTFENRVYFSGNDPANGRELWVSNGSPEGTYLLKDIIPGADDSMLSFTKDQTGTLYFASNYYDAAKGDVMDLWRTAGTASTTSKINTLCGACSLDTLSAIYNGELYFFLYQEYGTNKLWSTDGTADGTNEIFSELLDGGVPFFEEVNGQMIFYVNAQGHNMRFYRTNGVQTESFWQFNSSGSMTHTISLAKVGELLFFSDHDGAGDYGGQAVDPDDSFQLMQTDGFTVTSVRSIHGISLKGTDNITNYRGRVVFTTQDGYGLPKKLWIYDPAEAPVAEATFTIVNADTDEDIQEIRDGDVFVKPANTNINIRYNPVGDVESVVFRHQDKVVRTENEPPFALRGDHSGDYIPWTEGTAGVHKVAATPYSQDKAQGTEGETLVITFTIEETQCMAAGNILREYWWGIQGNQVDDIPVDREPDGRGYLDIFEGPTNVGINYGARIRGYICPPATGEYVFWLASNDHSRLYVSTDDDPANKVLVDDLRRATGPREWDRFNTQRSLPVVLTAGKRYYIEVLHKQGIGTDNIAVGWQLPDGTMERPIAGSRLSPFEIPMAMASTTAAVPEAGQIGVYPNPVQAGSPELVLSGYENISQPVETRVQIINMTGDIIFEENVSCGGDCGSYLMKVDEHLRPGVYFVKMNTAGNQHNQRLLVR